MVYVQSYEIKILSPTHHSKMYGLCHRGLSIILIYTKGDGNYQELKDINAKFPGEEGLVVEFFDSCSASNSQLPYIAVHKPVKKLIREEYHNHVTKLFSNTKKSANIKVGDEIPVS